MAEPVLISVAWPYANAEIHVGNLTGAYLPADIFARYQRMRGRQVLMVSGSDAHGTPITVRADAEKITAEDVYKRFHRGFLDLFQKVGLTYDLFTSTHTTNHFDISQKVFLALKKNGLLYPHRELQWYAPSQGRFLPDRYVEGTCYICGYTNARSDQCDKCGSPMLIKEGRYGKYLACSAYPECKNIQPLVKPKGTGVTCPARRLASMQSVLPMAGGNASRSSTAKTSPPGCWRRRNPTHRFPPGKPIVLLVSPCNSITRSGPIRSRTA